MSGDDYLKVLLAIVIWREARGETTEGMRAVAHVIRNRVNDQKQDWDTVITAKNQFTSMSYAGDSQLILWPDDDAVKFQQILQIAEDVFDGKDPDPTDGALYYWNPATATSGWFKANVVDRMVKTAVIGRHEFFRP